MTPSLAFTSFSATSGSIVLWWALVLKGPVSGLTSGMKGSVRLHPSLRCSSAQVISDQNWCTTLPWGMIPWLQYVQFFCFCCFCYTKTKRVWQLTFSNKIMCTTKIIPNFCFSPSPGWTEWSTHNFARNSWKPYRNCHSGEQVKFWSVHIPTLSVQTGISQGVVWSRKVLLHFWLLGGQSHWKRQSW